MDRKELRNRQGLTEAAFLKAYDAGKYERPSVTVDMLLFAVMNKEKESYRKLPEKVLKLLMIKRGDHPFMGCWALPGGFADVRESLDQAAQRELKEETNIENIYMEQLYTWGDVERDPRTRVIGCSYMALVDESILDVRAGDDAEAAEWFTVKTRLVEQQKAVTAEGYILQEWVDLTLRGREDVLTACIKITKQVAGNVTRTDRELVASNGIAFDHARIIEYGIERLRNKIQYTDIAFNLMPERFTLTELQQVYEVIMDKPLLKANFRRKIAGMVSETGDYTRDAGHRPSKLYRYNTGWKSMGFE